MKYHWHRKPKPSKVYILLYKNAYPRRSQFVWIRNPVEQFYPIHLHKICNLNLYIVIIVKLTGVLAIWINQFQSKRFLVFGIVLGCQLFLFLNTLLRVIILQIMELTGGSQPLGMIHWVFCHWQRTTTWPCLQYRNLRLHIPQTPRPWHDISKTSAPVFSLLKNG